MLFRVLRSFRNSISIDFCRINKLQCVPRRYYAAPPKRFYKNTGVICADGVFEVTLDQRKLKTPAGKVFRVDNELLALAVAAEWDSQKEQIQRSSMHLTSLCNTALDNPNRIVKFDAVQHIINFLETDTILFQSGSDDLFTLQCKEWNPVIEWFNERFGTEIKPTRDISSPSISESDRTAIEKHLLSYSLTSIHGFIFAVESLKSVILALCCIERKINVDQAVLLSRLEEEYQTGFWGRVEWAHDMSQLDLQSRVAAAVLFVHLTSMSDETKAKLISTI